ncbi:MAG: serine hydrolase domain-containing protein [Vicinamibacterales bacterium]
MTDAARRVLREVLDAAIAARVTPGAVLEVGDIDGAILVDVAGRLTYAAEAAPVTAGTRYDLASLTKVMATATLAMRLTADGTLPLGTRVVECVPAFTGGARDTVTVADLLAHAGGLPAHRPYYRRFAGRAAYQAALCREALTYTPRTRHEYTDLGFLLLAHCLEAATARPLAAQFDAWRDEAIPGADVAFGPLRRPAGDVAPTEADRWRGRVVIGHVHDGNAAAVGGAAGHAGLFGTAAAVGAYARWYLRLWLGLTAHSTGIPSALARQFATRGTVPGSSRALGWDTMLPTSSCGAHLSPTSIGHTGFTGTSLWLDPIRRGYVVLLTNRVHPDSASADGIRALRIAVHDAVALGWPP